MVLSLKLDIPDMTFIEGLQKKTGLDKRSFLNEAFTLYAYAVETREKGREIGSFDEKNGTYRVIELPGLKNVKPVP
jgi:hypothetical protein